MDTSSYRRSNYTVYILHTCPAGSCIHKSTSSRVGSFIVPETNKNTNIWNMLNGKINYARQSKLVSVFVPLFPYSPSAILLRRYCIHKRY